jgi:hypothetical protein
MVPKTCREWLLPHRDHKCYIAEGTGCSLFYRVHFQRSIDRIVKSSEQLRVMRFIMMSLLDRSSYDFTDLIQLLKGINIKFFIN